MWRLKWAGVLGHQNWLSCLVHDLSTNITATGSLGTEMWETRVCLHTHSEGGVSTPQSSCTSLREPHKDTLLYVAGPASRQRPLGNESFRITDSQERCILIWKGSIRLLYGRIWYPFHLFLLPVIILQGGFCFQVVFTHWTFIREPAIEQMTFCV